MSEYTIHNNYIGIFDSLFTYQNTIMIPKNKMLVDIIVKLNPKLTFFISYNALILSREVFVCFQTNR